ncbi:multiple sugar transport system substrate-binding protein [Paenibacillus castaneae]|uniref:ABC transporter substrate-binding protein n=1 Tax=Paenibacillus castaneae TaxID=474957 RepID=UPI000C9991CA|nr:extracellular solute-binding protein [Paenibacillus castaneae]NIK75072.1 multiple sugar transport system substrate-binding protein [Paenibacillus castaneae]
MKKTISMMIIVVLLFSITACSKPANTGETNKSIDEGSSREEAAKEKPPAKKDDNSPKTIVFSTFFEDGFFVEAKKKYEAKHPNITIEYSFIDSDDATFMGKMEEYIKKINTAMLSGNGPDLIQMDVLPIGKYVNKNLLADMSKMMDNDPAFKREDYFTNVLDGSKVNGSLYGMPLNFFMYGFIGNETVIEKSGVAFEDHNWSWNQFFEAAEGLKAYGDPNYSYSLAAYPEELLNGIVMDQYTSFVDEPNGKAKFDSDSFIQLLKQVKGLYDKGIATTENVHSIFREEQINSPSDYFLALKLSENFAKGYESYEYKSKLYSSPKGEGQGKGGYFRSYKTMGINEKSSVKEEAWDFVKFILSEEMQGSRGTGFPLNKEVYKQQVEELLKKGKVEDHPEGFLGGIVFTITAQDIEGLDIFLEQAQYPVAFNRDQVQEIIVEESKAYFSGQKSAVAVAKLMQNRISLYLNE